MDGQYIENQDEVDRQIYCALKSIFLILCKTDEINNIISKNPQVNVFTEKCN